MNIFFVEKGVFFRYLFSVTLTFIKCQFLETKVFNKIRGSFFVYNNILIIIRKDNFQPYNFLAKELLFPLHKSNLGVPQVLKPLGFLVCFKTNAFESEQQILFAKCRLRQFLIFIQIIYMFMYKRDHPRPKFNYLTSV